MKWSAQPKTWRSRRDHRIAKLLSDLNAAGFRTTSSCQGKTCGRDFKERRHCDHSFITFVDKLSSARQRRASVLGLHVYNGGMSVSALDRTEATQEEVMA